MFFCGLIVMVILLLMKFNSFSSRGGQFKFLNNLIRKAAAAERTRNPWINRIFVVHSICWCLWHNGQPNRINCIPLGKYRGLLNALDHLLNPSVNPADATYRFLSKYPSDATTICTPRRSAKKVIHILVISRTRRHLCPFHAEVIIHKLILLLLFFMGNFWWTDRNVFLETTTQDRQSLQFCKRIKPPMTLPWSWNGSVEKYRSSPQFNTITSLTIRFKEF